MRTETVANGGKNVLRFLPEGFGWVVDLDFLETRGLTDYGSGPRRVSPLPSYGGVKSGETSRILKICRDRYPFTAKGRMK